MNNTPEGRFYLCDLCRGEGRNLAYDRESPPGFEHGSTERCAQCGGATVIEPHEHWGEVKESRDLTEAERIAATIRWETALHRWGEGLNGTCRECEQPSGERRPLMVNYAREPAKVLMWCKDCCTASTIGLIELPEDQK